MIIRTRPKINILASEINLILSGMYDRSTAPKITPQIFPIPPKTTKAKIKIETSSLKIFGEINIDSDANSTPAAPPIAAPNTKAHSLYLYMFTPINSATSSSCRIASQARPGRRTESIRIAIIVIIIIIKMVQ